MGSRKEGFLDAMLFQKLNIIFIGKATLVSIFSLNLWEIVWLLIKFYPNIIT